MAARQARKRPVAASAAKNVVMLIGGRWHPFELCGRIAKEFLESTGRYKLTVTNANDVLAEGLGKYDGLIIYAQGQDITPAQEAGLLKFVRGGGGLVGIHCAADVFRNSRDYVKLIGSEFKTHPPMHQFRVDLVDEAHQATTRLGGFETFEEMYHLQNVNEDVQLLATTRWLGQPLPMMYTRTEGKGRVFYTALGHAEKQFLHPQFKKSLLHGLDWACKVKPAAGPIRCAMLGYGPAFGMGKQHSMQINATPGMKAVAACDIDPACTEQAKKDFPYFKTFSSVEAMLKDKTIDLVVIILPHNLHAPMAIQCLQAGKHVVLEKPFCLTVKEADAMIAAARRAGKMLTVYHNRRWDGDHMTIKRIIREGTIGEVFEINAGFAGYRSPGTTWRSDKAISGGNLYDWGAHFVDWVLALVPQKIQSVSGFFQKKVWMHVTNEDHTQAIVRFANGAMADIVISSLSAARRPRWRILGTKGAILDDGTVEKGCKVITYRDGSLVTSEVSWQSRTYQEFYWNVADHLLCGDELAVKGGQARRVIGVIEYAGRSSQSGKEEMFPGG